MTPRSARRSRGVTVVEVAITAPLAILLVIAMMVGTLGAFRYQQMATLARAGASYASLRGPYYALRTGRPRATAEDVMQHVVIPNAIGMSASELHPDLTFDTEAGTVTFSLQYDWLPEALLPAAILSSKSVVLIQQ